MSELVTLRELWQESGLSFQPRHFVSEPLPPSRYPFPAPFVPRYLMDPAEADRAEIALKQCTDLVGHWGSRFSRIKLPEFKEAAQVFKDATGVDVRSVISLARARFIGEPV